MSLNTAYVTAPSLQEYFVDKTTGAPLSGGLVYFYQDNSRTVYKNIYRLSGTPANYTYTALPNPVVLSSVGTIQDNNGNDVIPYYLPQVSLTDNTPDLYFIRVTSSDGTPQFTREAWPNPGISSGDVTSAEITNFIPNGQFLAHNNLPDDGLIDVNDAETVIAPGGWSFKRPAGTSTAEDYVTFFRYDEYTASPSASPRYAVEIVSDATSMDAYRDLRIKFNDVNKFASETQNYTFSFFGVATADVLVQLLTIKNFGAGGTSDVESAAQTVTITSLGGQINYTFIPGTNAGYTIGSGNDDFIEIAVRFPANVTFDITMTDFMLYEGAETINEFPQTTNADFLTRGVAGWMNVPDYDGFDLYLPLVLTRAGLEFNRSEIGKVYSTFVEVPGNGELLCDGAAYLVDDYSSTGIPYRRLFNVLSNVGTTIPLFGTGSNFATAFISALVSGSLNQIRLSTNVLSAALTNSADNNTTFTITTPKNAANPYAYKAFINGSARLIGIATINGVALASAVAGTSGFTVTQLSNNAVLPYEFTVQTIASAGLANPGGAGKYFSFSNTTTTYYMWFHFTNETDPAPGGTGIQVNLLTTYSASEVAGYVQQALAGYQISNIVTVAGSALPANSWWRFNASSTGYYVWYNKDSTGVDPAPGGLVGIEVDVLTADTDVQIASKTALAINSVYFAVPNLQGVFLRGFNNSVGLDQDSADRFIYANNDSVYGDHIGGMELGQIQSHLHTLTGLARDPTQGFAGGGGTLQTTTPLQTDSTNTTGGNETRPINVAVNFVIKY